MISPERLTHRQLQFLRSVVEASTEMSDGEITVRAKELKLPRIQAPCLVASVYLDYAAVPFETKDETVARVGQYIHSRLTDAGYSVYCMTDAKNRTVCLFSLQEKHHLEAGLNGNLVWLYKKLQQEFGLCGFIGVGNAAKTLAQISDSYYESLEMLEYKYQYSTDNVIFASQIVKFQYAPALTNGSTFDRVVGYFLAGDLGKFAAKLDELVEEVRNKPNVSGTSIKRTLAELIIHLIHIASNWHQDVDWVLEGKDPYNWIMEQTDTPTIREWILHVCTRLLELRQPRLTAQDKEIVLLAKEYIVNNLRKNELCLQDISSAQGISPNYLSAVFSNKTGEGVCNYITRLRIELACKLLTDTNLKMSIIAGQLGFSSANYFTQVFRRTMGVTPTKYRKKTVKT